MESNAKSDAVNGAPQKVIKPTSMMHAASGPSVERNGDRGETIEDIISELNATAKKDEPLAEVPTLGCLESEREPNLDSSDQWERKTDSLPSSPGSVAEVTVLSEASVDEAEPAIVLTDASAGRDEVPVPCTHEIPSEGGEKPAEATNGGTAELESLEILECSDATGAVAESEPTAEPELADESSEKNLEEKKPNSAMVGAGSKEDITSTCEIKVPDEALQSPRRTPRQRTISLKMAESNTSNASRMRRHGSETSGASSGDSSPVKQGSKKSLTSDSESDVPLAQKRRKMLCPKTQPTVSIKKLTSDSESDTPLAKKRQKTTSVEGRSISALKTKRLATDSESDSPIAKKKNSPSKGPGFTVKLARCVQVKKVSKEPPSIRRLIKRPAKQSPETNAMMKDNNGRDIQGSSRSCATDTGFTIEKKTPNLASKIQKKGAQQKLPADSCGNTPAEQNLREDHEKPGGGVELMNVKGKGNMGMLESALTTGSVPFAMVTKRIKKVPKSKELVTDDLNVSNTSTSDASRAAGREKHIATQTTITEVVGNVSAWSAHQFTESDRLLQESINLSLKDREPVTSRSYLMVEIPPGNARRLWGSASTHRRPTVVFGGCDPLNTYLNIKGARISLHEWQQVSRITPTVRLTDIFRCLSST